LPPQFIYDTLDSPTDVWMFRQQFINQLAVVSFMNYVMHMANRLPHTIAFARNSGNVVLSDLYMSMLADIHHLPGPLGWRSLLEYPVLHRRHMAAPLCRLHSALLNLTVCSPT
jgi:hypothetical protein